MYVRRAIRTRLILRFAWKNILGFIVWATLITGAYVLLRPRGVDIRLPFLPLSTIGIAVSFYLGFKNNQSYDRFWEARTTWGGIINLSRTWASQVRTYVSGRFAPVPPDPAALHEQHQVLLYRQLAWANALRVQLRRTTVFDRFNISYMPNLSLHTNNPTEPQVDQFLSAAEYSVVQEKVNPAAHLLDHQALALQECLEAGLLDDFRQMELMQTVKDCYALQGACERIKNTPFPRQYAYFSTIFTWLFVLLLPFGLVGEFSEFSQLGRGMAVWLTVPFSVLISWIFTTIEIVGDNSEDPFENYINDVPMTALCRSLEIDLREMLGETELPPRIQPVNDILL